MKKHFLGAIILFYSMLNNIVAQNTPCLPCSDATHVNEIGCKAMAVLKDYTNNKILITAHRGSWGNVGVPENSMTSFQNAAAEHDVFTELDVMVTKDSVMILNHDSGPRRTTSYNYNVNFSDLNYYTVTTINGITYPALKDAYVKDRQGNITTETLKSLDSALNYLAVHTELVLKLDCKNVYNDQAFFLRSLKLEVQKAIEKGVLHRCIFTIVNKGDSRDPSYIAPLPSDIQTYFNDSILYNNFVNNSNINVVVNVPVPSKEYIMQWGTVPGVVTYEFANTNLDDPMFNPLIGLTDTAGNTLNPMQYVDQVLHKKASVFFVAPIDARGLGADSPPKSTYSFGELPVADYRGSLEYLFFYGIRNGKIGSFTGDRVPVLVNFLNAVSMLNPKYLTTNY